MWASCSHIDDIMLSFSYFSISESSFCFFICFSIASISFLFCSKSFSFSFCWFYWNSNSFFNCWISISYSRACYSFFVNYLTCLRWEEASSSKSKSFSLRDVFSSIKTPIRSRFSELSILNYIFSSIARSIFSFNSPSRTAASFNLYSNYFI